MSYVMKGRTRTATGPEQARPPNSSFPQLHSQSRSCAEESEIKQALADHAAEVILAAATSKLDAPELAQSIGWDRISFLVTELPPDSLPRVYRDLTEVV
jgi:DeoR/GlpR family transcriptional regulator of sugar metabolism